MNDMVSCTVRHTRRKHEGALLEVTVSIPRDTYLDLSDVDPTRFARAKLRLETEFKKQVAAVYYNGSLPSRFAVSYDKDIEIVDDSGTTLTTKAHTTYSSR